MAAPTKIDIPDKMTVLFTPSRYKVFRGGRGGGKSHSIAKILILMAASKKLRILCAREFQNSIGDSVHKLLSDQIEILKLQNYFEVTQTAIRSKAGSEFIFKGIRHAVQEIKSLEGIDICWVEEAQGVSNDSWEVLIPTIRKEKSEIWVSFNPGEETDPTYQRFVTNKPDNCILVEINWRDNPWFPQTLRDEMEHCKRTDYASYLHIWEGQPKKLAASVIFAGKFRTDIFDPPPGARFFYGMDFGFSNDPTAVTRSFIFMRRLWIDHEAGGHKIEISDLHKTLDSIPGSRKWPIRADGSRPETISAVRRQGFDIAAAPKWSGSVEDGIAYLKGFDEIVVHERCVETLKEFGLYSYKVDRQTKEILPLVVDKNNHYLDSIRYGLSGYIRARDWNFQ